MNPGKRHGMYRGPEKINSMFFGYDCDVAQTRRRTFGNYRRAKRTVISSDCRSEASASCRRRRLADHITSQQCRRRDDTDNNWILFFFYAAVRTCRKRMRDRGRLMMMGAGLVYGMRCASIYLRGCCRRSSCARCDVRRACAMCARRVRPVSRVNVARLKRGGGQCAGRDGGPWVAEAAVPSSPAHRPLTRGGRGVAVRISISPLPAARRPTALRGPIGWACPRRAPPFLQCPQIRRGGGGGGDNVCWPVVDFLRFFSTSPL